MKKMKSLLWKIIRSLQLRAGFRELRELTFDQVRREARQACEYMRVAKKR